MCNSSGRGADGRCDGGRGGVCVTAVGAELVAGVMVGVVVYV